MVRPVAVLVAVLVVLAGCAAPVAGSAVADEAAAREAAEPLSSQRALGDYPSLDYCSLMDQKSFPQRLGLVAVYPRGSYDYCVFSVQKSGTEARVQIGYLEDQETISGADHTVDRRRTPPRGLEVHRGTEDNDVCVRYLRFTDDLLLTVVASIDDVQTSRDLCEIADATVDIVIDRLVARKVKHYEFAEKALGRVDACDLVPAQVVGTKIGAAGATPLKFPSRHVCHWTGPARDSPIARLYVAPGESSYDPDHSKDEQIAGRRTTVTLTPIDADDVALCQLETSEPGWPQQPVAEFVLIEVVVLGKEKDACGPARELAKEVWAKLPR
jgi:hypothetical protein